MSSSTTKTTSQPYPPLAHATNECHQTAWYEPDDGPLTEEQIADIRKLVPQGICLSIRSSLLCDSIAS